MYKLTDPDLSARAESFAAADDPGALDSSIALLHTLIEAAINAKQFHTVPNLMTCLARLVHQSDQRLWRASEVIHRTVLTKLASSLADAIAYEFRDTCDDWQDRLERVGARFVEVIDEVENPRKLLEG